MHCSSCGANLPPTSDFCPYCGTQIGGTEAADEAPAAAKPGPWSDPEPQPRTEARATQSGPWPDDASLDEDASLDDAPEPKKKWWQRKKKRKVRSSLKEPPRARMPLWQSLPLVIGTVVILALVTWSALHLWQTRDAVKTVTTHLNAIMAKKWAAAYTLTAAGFRKTTPEQQFTLFVRGTRSLAQLAYYAAEDREMRTDQGTVRFLLIDRSGKHTPAAFDLVKEGTTWRIASIRLGDDADSQSKPQPLLQKTTTTTPNKTETPKTKTPVKKTEENEHTGTDDVTKTTAPETKKDSGTSGTGGKVGE